MEWISVQERLPEKGEPVLIVWIGHVQHVTYCLGDDEWVPSGCEDCDTVPIKTFSHWMPLPDPPAVHEEEKPNA